MSIKARERIEEDVRLLMRREIARAEGQEVLFVGHVDRNTMVYAVEVYARGGESAVAAPMELCERGDLVIHNHPSGVLRPSEADVAVSARLAEMGIASAIVDNDVEDMYVLVEPFPAEEVSYLDIDRLAGALEDGGEVARLLDGFRERPSQVAMTRMIAAAFNETGIAVAEAGTGVGKSFAYLIPAVAWAAQNRERVVIATATINLQQQLVDQDVPTVQRALGTDVTVALVKGRGNYLCRRRLAEQLEEFAEGETLFEEWESVRAVAEWADTSPTGSRNDLPFHLSDEQWGRVNSEADMCAVSRCPNRERCFILRARRRAAGAQILVANHHLVFSDLAVRRAGAGWDATAILPPFQRLIFDEAHNLERAATSFFSESVSYWGLVRQAGRLLRKRGARRFGLMDRLSAIVAEQGALEKAEAAVERMRSIAEDLNKALSAFLADETSWRLTDATAEELRSRAGVALFDARGALVELASRLAEIAGSVEERFREEGVFFELGAYIRRLETIASAIERFARAEPDDEMVLWMERRLDGRRNAYVTLHATPLDIRPLMRESVFERYETIVMTSATLTINDDFQFWGARLGLFPSMNDVRTGRFASPFDYASRVMLAVPTDAPGPTESYYNRYLEILIPRLVNAAGGGALVLFTSYRQLQEIYGVIAPGLEQRGFSCYRQGTDDRARLLESFRADIASVLFATDSFWEGIDLPGETLRLVVLCRLPFRVPTDPVQLARSEAVEQAGGNAFAEFSLPQAVMRLKQGFGRLMRRSEDYGAVVVADARMIRKSYGRVFWNSLPPARPFTASGEELIEEVGDFLSRLSGEG